MPKFTPGPWKLYSHSLAPWEQHRIENDHGNHVCELMEADQPDARLIAASPELYDALILAEECLIGILEDTGMEPGDIQNPDCMEGMKPNPLLVQIRRALAKVDGEQS